MYVNPSLIFIIFSENPQSNNTSLVVAKYRKRANSVFVRLFQISWYNFQNILKAVGKIRAQSAKKELKRL